MKAQSSRGSSKPSTSRKPARPGPTAKGEAVYGYTRYKNAGAKDRKLGYGGETYPTQAQVKKAAKKRGK